MSYSPREATRQGSLRLQSLGRPRKGEDERPCSPNRSGELGTGVEFSGEKQRRFFFALSVLFSSPCLLRGPRASIYLPSIASRNSPHRRKFLRLQLTSFV